MRCWKPFRACRPMDKPVICTVIAKNYLAQARCLTDSFLRHHPDGEVFVLVIDEIGEYYDPAEERFATVKLDEIGIRDLPAMIRRYTVLELSTAVKPFFLEYLFEALDCDKICYFDPDIYFYNPITEIWDLLDSYGVVLTPHLLDFLEDSHWPNELDVLRSGSYNLGFIGLSLRADLIRLLHWWQRKVAEHCFVSLHEGLFVDQKWMDLAPSLFSNVHVHRDPGCNVAYWNLKNRQVRSAGAGYTVNGTPLKFFHFSGFSPERMNSLSKYQDRFTLRDLPDARPLFEGYRDCLVAHGYARIRRWPYTHDHSAPSGVRIPDQARRLWKEWETGGRPGESTNLASDAAAVDEFLSWINEPVDVDPTGPTLTRLAMVIYEDRRDLQQIYPDVLGKDRSRYVSWLLSRAKAEFGLDDFFIRPMRKTEGVAASGRPIRDLGARLYVNVTNSLFHIGVGRWLEDRLGRRFVNRARGFFLATGPDNEEDHLSISQGRRSQPPSPMGLNTVEYVYDGNPDREVAAVCAEAVQEHGFPVIFSRVSSRAADEQDRQALWVPEAHPYRFNCLHVDVDRVEIACEELGDAFFAGKYNIGYWGWEVDPFPDDWTDRFRFFDEIWVASSFVQKLVAPASPIPVIVTGAPVAAAAGAEVTRDQFGLPENRFLFLFAFDMLSGVERKNPYGVIEAYQRAFGSTPHQTQLVIWAANLHRFSEHARRLKRAVDSVAGTLIDRDLRHPLVEGLIHNADAYVSLHRSEGFGWSIAKAMRFGTPTIATDYSAPQDYLNIGNGYPVGYGLTEMGKECGPYRRGSIWADADLDHAAAQMQRVVEHPEEARLKGQQAVSDIQRLFGREVVANRMVERLKRISSWRR